MKKLKAAYKRLNYEEYTNAVRDTLVPLFDDYDGEFIVIVGKSSKFSIVKKYFEGKLLGYNICADGCIVETKSTLKKARKYLYKLVADINKI